MEKLRRISWTMCLLTVRENASLQRIWIRLRRFASMPACLARSRFQHQSVTMRLTGPSPSMIMLV